MYDTALTQPGEGLPPIVKVAPDSNQPRVQSKVVIITGIYMAFVPQRDDESAPKETRLLLTRCKGANSPLGIGRAAAHQFALNGAQAVYICDFDDTHLEAHAREIRARCSSVQVHPRGFDAANEAQVKAVVEDALRRYGRLDVFFANAGLAGAQVLFTAIEADEFMNIMRVNALGVLLAAKHAAPAMQKTSPEKLTPGGSIIMTASVAGLRSNAGSTPYSASKAAVISMAQTIAYQLAGTNVRCNAICPGVIETGITAPMYEYARKRGTERKIGHLNPLARGGVSDEIARVALFLGSDESSYVNAQAWAVDGGLSGGHPFVRGKLA